MSEWKVVTRVEPNNGRPGFFWKDGERWLRTGDRMRRVADLAPHLEAQFMLDLDVHNEQARIRSLDL